MKKFLFLIINVAVLALTVVTGASAGVMMADATALPDAGKVAGGEGGTGGTTETTNNTRRVDVDPSGIATETAGRETAHSVNNDEFYLNDVDKRITKIRPMATPIDQISRYGKNLQAEGFKVKYYSVGTRPVSCKVGSGGMDQMSSSAASIVLNVSDVNMFTLDDTIRVIGVNGVTDPDTGNNYDPTTKVVPELVLCVCGRDNTTNKPIVYAVNGGKNSSGQPIIVPAIAEGTTLVRMGKACGELDVQTGRFNNQPTPEYQYCQNFMIQIEQSTFDKIAAKEVDWGFSDLEEDGIYDMRLAQENSYLFGVKNVIQHVSKNNMQTWFTGGLWWMAGKDIEVGEWDFSKGCCVISDDNLVDITKDLFVGTGIGNKRKLLFCGSNMLSAFSKIKSEKFRLKDTVEVWNLKFKSWDTDFGEVLTIHHELFDANGMSDYGFALDPEYLTKKTHVSWSRNVLDLKKAGVRNTDAVVIQEVACLYLRYAKAHARMRLAQQPKVATPEIKGTTPFVSTTSVTMECATAGADIYYTTGDTLPTAGALGTKYTSAITCSSTTTYNAVAVKDGYIISDVTTKTFTKS